MANQENTSTEGRREDILLGVLTAIDRDSNTSQRTISRELNVALGLANAYLKRCVRKGLIKIKQVPRRRYVYYLTPQGFAEKSRLTAQFLSASFTFFRRAREQISELMRDCTEQGLPRIAFAGVSDLTEVGTRCARTITRLRLWASSMPSTPASNIAGCRCAAAWRNSRRLTS